MITRGTVGDIDLEFLRRYLCLDELSEDDIEIEFYLNIAKEYLLEETKKTLEELNTSKILTVPLLLLVAEFYSNKSVTLAANTKINPILDRFIGAEKGW